MALANIVEGDSGLQYERDIARLELTAPRGQDGRLPPVRMVALPADIQQRHLLLHARDVRRVCGGGGHRLLRGTTHEAFLCASGEDQGVERRLGLLGLLDQ